MANDNRQELTDTMEKAILGPMRRSMGALLDHIDAINTIQIEAAQSYTDLTFREVRRVLDIRDPDGLRAYVTQQPETAKAFSERVKDDAEKLTQANQAFMETAQQVTQESVSKVQKAAEEGVERVQKAAAAN